MVQSLVIDIETKLFENGVVRIAVDHGEGWRHLRVRPVAKGSRARCEFGDGVNLVRVMARIMGPAYGLVVVSGLLPSANQIEAIRLAIEPDQANTWINAYGDLAW